MDMHEQGNVQGGAATCRDMQRMCGKQSQRRAPECEKVGMCDVVFIATVAGVRFGLPIWQLLWPFRACHAVLRATSTEDCYAMPPLKYPSCTSVMCLCIVYSMMHRLGYRFISHSIDLPSPGSGATRT